MNHRAHSVFAGGNFPSVPVIILLVIECFCVVESGIDGDGRLANPGYPTNFHHFIGRYQLA